MLKYKKTYKNTFVAYLMIILKFLYLSTILIPTQVHRKQGGRGAIAMSFQIVLQKIAISLSNFFSI